MTTQVKTAEEIAAMRAGGQILAEVLRVVATSAQPGMGTLELSRLADQETIKRGGKPALIGYEGFPEGMCVSINDEVIHGVPRKDKIISEGDIVSVDYCVLYKGMITDAAVTFIVGQPSEAKDIELLAVTKKALKKGIEAVRDGAHIGDIGAAVQRVLDSAGFGIVREFVGHGVGHHVHEEPGVPNHGPKGKGMILKAGMTIAIEPMAMIGSHEIYIMDDGWTVKTRDGSRAAHFEHTVLVTEDGYEILTA